MVDEENPGHRTVNETDRSETNQGTENQDIRNLVPNSAACGGL
jgi:hypothetical protein